MKNVLFVLLLAVALGCSSGAPDKDGPEPAAKPAPPPQAVKTIPDSEIGLAAGTAFQQPAQAPIAFNRVGPGESELRVPPNAEFPPVIPHSVEDLGPITLSENPCLDCHNADIAEEMGAVPVPASHRMDLRNSPGETGDEVTGARQVCVSCHVAQTDTEPRVAVVRP